MKVWDVFVRLSHWLTALLVMFSWLSIEFNYIEFVWHSWSGFAIFILLLGRLAWGVVGSTTARFSYFIKSPVKAIIYLRNLCVGEGGVFVGHNPAGGLMAVLLWMMLLAQAVTGMFSSDDILFEGPFAYNVSEGTVNNMTGWHHALFDMLMVIVVIHISAVIYHQVIKEEKIIQAMVTGKNLILKSDDEKYKFLIFKSFYFALSILGLLALVFWIILSVYA